MILLQVNQLSKYFGAEIILSNIKLEVQTRDRIALVGRNGAGKSTLLKMIAGQLSYDSGEIIKPKNVEIGYLAQNTGLESNLSIWDEMLTVFKSLQQQEAELRKLEQQMADPAVSSQPDRFEKILKEYDVLQYNFKENGGYQYEADIRSVLHGLNFASFDYSTKISTLSGGQKTRLALAKLLLTTPEILILDEPTNHLDIETLSWLEQYLQGYDGAVLIVSHDRYFLDRIVNKIFSFEGDGKILQLVGNYSDYSSLKEQESKEQKEISEPKIKDNLKVNSKKEKPLKFTFKEQKEFEEIDDMIEAKEEAISELEVKINNGSSDFVLLQELLTNKTQLEEDLEYLLERWTYLNELNEKIINSKS